MVQEIRSMPDSEVTSSVVDKADLFVKLNKLKAQNARFLTITAIDHGENIEVVYNFEVDSGVVNLSINTGKEEPLASITSVYGAAFVAENEIQDLFNLKFVGLNVDLGGKMLRVETAKETTLLKPLIGDRPPIMRFYGRCREECPAMVNIPKYVRQIAAGDPKGAYNTVMEMAPIPAILGRVCFAPCQDSCRQENRERPIQIRLLKRYAADSMKSLKGDVKRAEPTGKRIAIIGGGPAGITAAYYLGMKGHDVTLYEKRSRSGGAMLWGIPKYRLPKDILEEEAMARFEESGVKFVPNSEILELDTLFKEGFDAIYVAIGAQVSNRLRVEGENAPGIIDCMDLLTTVNVRNESPDLGDKVIIIGGGNAAIDAARTSKRLGVRDVTLYYRRTETEMPALLHEIHDAMREGVSFDLLSQPIKIIQGERLTIAFQCMIPGEPDESGRRRPVPLEGSIIMREADTIVKAIGCVVAVPDGYGLKVNRRGWIEVDEEYRTSREGVWAGGDAVFGPRIVIEAIRDGRKAASSIDKYLGGDGLPEPSIDMDEFVSRPENLENVKELAQVECRVLPVNTRIRGFDEVELGFNEEEAVTEASRCWRCDWNE